tara:strand:+ start:419 stop:760 length:342 start_codon:yes stop_codon:yes gene_type:complete
MRHTEKALNKMTPKVAEEDMAYNFIEIEKTKDEGIAPTVKFTMQSDPVSEVGVNGCQAVDMLEYVGHLFTSLNESFPCIENQDTIDCIQEALLHQEQRTADRENRKVEGTNQI